MRYLLLIISLLSNTCFSQGKPIVIAVMDTGFGYNKESTVEKRLCKYGHRDFTSDNKWANSFKTVDRVPLDLNRHGTNVVGTIENTAGKGNYCFVIVKFISNGKGDKSLDNDYRNTIRYIVGLKPTIINYSGGGAGFDEFEYKEIKKYLDNGGILVTAAGNNGYDLDDKKNAYYPAMYDPRIIVVGNKNEDGTPHYASSYGSSVKYWENGVNVVAFGIKLTGSSQATAIETGKIVKLLNEKKL